MKKLFTLMMVFYGFGICYGAINLLTKATNLELFTDAISKLDENDFAGGNGTQNDPYKITTAIHLNLVRDYPNSHFIQMSDINLDVSPWNEGKGWVPICNLAGKPFSGSFNGNGYQITNLKINTPDSSYTGLFGRAVTAVFEHIKITGADIKGKDYAGSLAGQALGGTLTDISVSGNVTGTGQFIGGIFGLVSDVSIIKCTSEANVTGNKYVGGLAGSGTAENCTATGKVTGLKSGQSESSGIGGLLGQGIALNSHASGEVTGANEVGGLIGSGSARGSYASGNVTATGDYVGGLIGDMNVSEESPDQNYEYMPGEPAPSATSKITKSSESNGTDPIIITLDDETRVLIPGNEAPFQATLEKMETDLSVDEILPTGTELSITGSMRRLTVSGSGDALPVKPVITIPVSEAGSINPETINALRVGIMEVNGEQVESYSAILPVWKDENGNFKFVDALFPDGLTADNTKSADINNQKGTDLGENKQVSNTFWVGEVRYFLISFDKSLNWSKRPVLERMIPDSTLADNGYRRTARTASAAQREKLAKQPVCNIVILVHGHNEEEKGGYVESRINSPWEFNYKRLVWDLLYEDIAKNSNKQYPTACTAFYEFISPTYRPIFSPVQDKSGIVHKTLGEDLGNMINQELFNNAQFKAMLDANMPFNLFIVAHSQGGLIARAGLRFIDPKILKNLKKVITWGSPHSGAGLYTMRYALAVGHDMIIDGVRFPMQNIGQSNAYQSAISALALDAPGIRDLRWDASKKDKLRLGDLFKENSSTINEFPESELPGGKMFFSDNLKLFNENEGAFIGDYLQGKYKFYDATTPKNAPLEFGWDWWKLKQIYNFGKNATEIEKGAQLNKLVMSSDYNASDGAVAVYSQRGDGIWSGGNIQKRSVDDTDHEEYYGGEPPHRDDNSIPKGKQIVAYTFSDLEITGETRKCPELELEKKEVGDSVVITGELVFPLYLPANGGDGLPGKKIIQIEARHKKPDGVLINAISFKYKDDGTFEGKGKNLDIPNDSVVVVVVLKDQSKVAGLIEDKIENLVFNFSKKIWYSIIQKAIDEAGQKDTLIVYPGTYKEWLNIGSKNITVQSKFGADVTIIEGSKYDVGVSITNSEPVVDGFTFKNFYRGIYIREWGTGKTIKPVIANNKILNSSNAGMYITGQVAPKIQNNIIADSYYYGIDFDEHFVGKGDEKPLISFNTISGSYRGIRVTGDYEVDIFDNIINNNEYGIEIVEKATARILRNKLTGNTWSGIRCYVVTKAPEIRNNIIKQSGNAIDIRSDGSYEITGNTLTDNRNGIAMELGYTVSSSALISKNTITGSKSEYAEGGSGIRVSWNGHPGSVQITDNIITGNHAEAGGGIYLSTSDNVTVSGNTITGNKSANFGGGIYNGSSGNVIISKNTISENSAGNYGGGIMIQYGTKTSVTDNIISNNNATESGGGIWGTPLGWEKTAVVTVAGQPLTVIRYVPCFTETTNTYSGNSNGKILGEWGPGTDKWCDDSGYDVYVIY